MEMREYIEAIAESCRKLIISKPATKQEEYRKIIVQKKEAFFQMEKYTDKQVFHENLSVEELEAALEELMQNHFRSSMDLMQKQSIFFWYPKRECRLIKRKSCRMQ